MRNDFVVILLLECVGTYKVSYAVAKKDPIIGRDWAVLLTTINMRPLVSTLEYWDVWYICR